MFHVPERDRIVNDPDMGSTAADGNNGAFAIVSPEPGWHLMLICADATDPIAEGWEHVSVRAFQGKRSRIPSWKEMAFVKGVCWDDDDVVMELHPARSGYINLHPHVLHLWRPTHVAIPLPPTVLV